MAASDGVKELDTVGRAAGGAMAAVRSHQDGWMRFRIVDVMIESTSRPVRLFASPTDRRRCLPTTIHHSSRPGAPFFSAVTLREIPYVKYGLRETDIMWDSGMRLRCLQAVSKAVFQSYDVIADTATKQRI